MNILSYTITTFCMASIAYAQTNQHVDQFKKDFITEWNKEAPLSFDTLIAHDSDNKDSTKLFIEDLQNLRDGLEDSKIVRMEYISENDYEKSKNGDSSEDYSWLDPVFDQSTEIAQSGLCFNIPLAGVFLIAFQNESRAIPVGMHGGKLRIAGTRNANEQEKADAHQKLLQQRNVNKGLLTLRCVIGRTNQEGKQVTLIVVNKGDNNHLIINGHEVLVEDLKDFIVNLEKIRGAQIPIIVVDCGDDNKVIYELMEPLVESHLTESVIYSYEDSSPR